MSIGRDVKQEKNVLIRDVNADYVEANLAEYEKFTRSGEHERATHVANVLKKLGHEVEAPKKTAREKAAAATSVEKAVPADTTEKAVDAK